MATTTETGNAQSAPQAPPNIDMRTIRQITGGKAATLHYIDAEAKRTDTKAASTKQQRARAELTAYASGLRYALAIIQDTTDL